MGREIERLFRVEIRPKLGHKHIAAVSKSDVLDLLDAIVDRGSPITANRAFATLRQLFNRAIDRDLLKVSPMPKSAPAPKPLATASYRMKRSDWRGEPSKLRVGHSDRSASSCF